MTISARVVAHSISPAGKTIASVQLRYPKFIHGEVMTHRVFSRSAASSRAIPVERVIQDVIDDPAIPVHWGKKQKGMQADEEFDVITASILQSNWLAGRDMAIVTARALLARGLHKQVANRVLEPYFHINTLVTATEWDNFFELRCHKDAQPEMRVLAEAIRDALSASDPRLLAQGEWHLPYVDHVFALEHTWALALKLSTARCARVSYLTQDGKEPNADDDLELYNRLVVSQPIHASPAEHQAQPDVLLDVMGKKQWQHEDQWRNFKGWRQYRAFIDA